MPTSIKIENLSKQYRLGVIGTGTLSHDLKRWWTTSIRGKEDPYLKIGETNDRATKGASEYVWALKDINLEIEQGDVVGIIGKNGAGKSTLLKILSRVTKPTTGSIKYNGRIASLLEVGTGFHPEMTGRENIYMNGAIMGMTRHEITSKLDEIIAFAGVERYIDTPVKRYSSGMTVRLGFSIAAHLEPDILVVDEVLAVGDAEFQKKAIGKMQDVSKGGGRTVLFVSHNMGAMQSLCKNGIILENGLLKYKSDINDVISNYAFKQKHENTVDLTNISRSGLANIDFKYLQMTVNSGNGKKEILEGEDINIDLKFEVNSPLENLAFGVAIRDNLGNNLIECRSFGDLPGLIIKEKCTKAVRVKISQNLKAGTYSLSIGAISKIGSLDYLPAVYTLFIQTNDLTNGEPWYKSSVGVYGVKHIWELEK